MIKYYIHHHIPKFQQLLDLAKQRKSRFICSTSSITEFFCHIHLLLTNSQPLNLNGLSSPELLRQSGYTNAISGSKGLAFFPAGKNLMAIQNCKLVQKSTQAFHELLLEMVT